VTGGGASLTSTLPGDWQTVEDCPADWHDWLNSAEIDWFVPAASSGDAAMAAAAVATPNSVAKYLVIKDHFLFDGELVT
jgi:hypothetical protein